jgi:hypothetical protein
MDYPHTDDACEAACEAAIEGAYASETRMLEATTQASHEAVAAFSLATEATQIALDAGTIARTALSRLTLARARTAQAKADHSRHERIRG